MNLWLTDDYYRLTRWGEGVGVELLLNSYRVAISCCSFKSHVGIYYYVVFFKKMLALIILSRVQNLYSSEFSRAKIFVKEHNVVIFSLKFQHAGCNGKKVSSLHAYYGDHTK